MIQEIPQDRNKRASRNQAHSFVRQIHRKLLIEQLANLLDSKMVTVHG